MTPLPKKNSDRFRRYITPLLTLVAASVSSAQTVAPAKDKEAPKEEEVIVLTPFTVDASKDKGYYAENTLAGSRLRTNISDLAASISVITKQQLEDTASVDLNDVFRYEINTEGSTSYTPSVQSLRSDGVVDVNAGFTQGGSGAPQTNATANRVRGLGVPSMAINYYPAISQVPVDSYNVQSLEISRGPNSMLFGLGSPAGIVNQSWAQAVLNRDKYTVSFRTDNYGSFRGSVSFNKSLIKDKLAIYGALLYNHQQFARKPSYDDTQRKYAAITFRPLAKTTLKASVEAYKNDNRRPNTLTPRDGVTEWKKAGQPIYDALTHTVTYKDGTVKGPYILDSSSPYANQVRSYIMSLPGYSAANWNTTGVAQTSYNGISIFGDGAMTTAGTLGTGANAGVFTFNNVLYAPGISFPSQARSIMRISNGALDSWFMPVENQQYRNGWGTAAAPESNPTSTLFPTKAAIWANPTWADIHNRYYTSSALTSNNGTLLGGYKYPGVTDKAIYDWTKTNINQMNFGHETNKTYNLELEQEILPNLFLNAGMFRQEFESKQNYTVAQLNVTTLFVDTNKYNVDGSINKFAGQVYVEDQDPDQFVNNEKDDHKRVMLAYTPDFTKNKGWTKWLGHHQLLALWSNQETMKEFRRQRVHYVGAGSDAAAYRFFSNHNNTVTGAATGWSYLTTSLRHMYYLSDPGDPAGAVTGASGEWNAINYTGNINVYDYASSSFQNQLMTTNYIDRNEGTGRTQRKISSYSGGITSYLWNDRLITTFGVRQDQNRARGTTNGAISRQELSTGDATKDVDIVTNKVVVAGAPVAIVKARTAVENFPSGLNGYYETKDLFNRWNRWDELTGTTRTLGGVLKPFKNWASIERKASGGSQFWQLVRDFGISYNKSDNFNPPAVAEVDVFGKPLPKPTGKGRDYGFQFSMLDGKLFARFTWFDSSNLNERTSPGTSISRFNGNVDTTLFRGWARTIALINMGKDPTVDGFGTVGGSSAGALTQAEDDQAKLAAEKIWQLPYDYYSNLPGAINATRDAQAKGVEMQINYNPTRNWTMKFTAGKQTTVYNEVLAQFDAWYAVRYPIWEAAKASNYLLPAYQSRVTYTSSGGRFVDLTNFLSSYGYDTSVPLSGTTVLDVYNRDVVPQAQLARDLKGQAAPGQRRYRGSIISNYTFTGERTKGFFVGGSQRWEDKAVIGYYGKASRGNPNNPNLIDISDVTKPIYDKANFYTDLWVGYTRKILNGKVSMRLQLNVNNVFENGGLRTVGVNYDGSPYAYRIIDSRQYNLTSTFEF